MWDVWRCEDVMWDVWRWRVLCGEGVVWDVWRCEGIVWDVWRWSVVWDMWRWRVLCGMCGGVRVHVVGMCGGGGCCVGCMEVEVVLGCVVV